MYVESQRLAFAQWQAKKKRSLENPDDEVLTRYHPGVASSSATSNLAQVQQQQMLEAKYYVKRMSQENEELGQRLHDESVVAQTAVQNHFQHSQASDQHRHNELHTFMGLVEGLKQQYHSHMENNDQRVRQYQEQGVMENQGLRHEMSAYAHQCRTFEHEESKEIEKLRHTAVYWQGAAEQQEQIVTQNSEQFAGELQSARVADHLLRQRFQAELTAQPAGQSESHLALLKAQQDSAEQLRHSENIQFQPDKSLKQGRLLNEEVFSRDQALQIVTLSGQAHQADAVRSESMLVQEKIRTQSSIDGWKKSHESAVVSQTECVQA